MIKRGKILIIFVIFVMSVYFASAINISFNSGTPADNTVLTTRDNFYVNVTIGNFTGTPNVILELNSSIRVINYTMSNLTNSTFQFNVTFLMNKTFQYRVHVNDSINSNITVYREINISYIQPWEYNSSYWTTTYIDNIGSFWANQFIPSSSTFYMNVNITGDANNELLRTQMLGRHIYGMAVAYNLTSNETYKSMALNATNTLRETLWDDTSGGFSDDDFNVSNPSEILVPRNQKTMFGQSWASLAFLSAYWISNNSTFLEYAEESYALYEEKTWNSTDKAYADIANDTWEITSDDYTFSSTVDVAIALVLPLYTLTGNSTYLTRLKEITDASMENMINETNDLVVGNYNPGWQNNGNTEQISVGHNTKYAWYLIYMYNLTGNDSYKTTGINIFRNASEIGWEDQYNIWYDQINTTTNQSVSSSIYWWIIEDGIVGGQILHKYTGDEYYYELFKKSTGTYIEKFLDTTNGEVYEVSNESGSITNFDKGYEYKGTYHSAEAAVLLSNIMNNFLGVPYGSFGTLAANQISSSTTSTTSNTNDDGVLVGPYKKNKINPNQSNNSLENDSLNISNKDQEDIEDKSNNSNLKIISISLVIIAVIFLIVFFIIRYKKE